MKEIQTRDDRREFKGWRVSIPCLVEQQDLTIRGQVDNLTYDGVVITRVCCAVPAEGTRVVVRFHFGGEKAKLEGRITSRAIHRVWEIMEDLNTGSFSVEFEAPLEKVTSKLNPIFHALIHAELTSGR